MWATSTFGVFFVRVCNSRYLGKLCFYYLMVTLQLHCILSLCRSFAVVENTLLFTIAEKERQGV